MRHRPSFVVALGLGAPALATGAALALNAEADITATALDMLAVISSAILGGRSAGILAATASALTLNFFWTEPRHTFRVSAPEDVISLSVFIVIAVVVSEIVGRLTKERERVSERDRASAQLTDVAQRLESERVRLDREARDARERIEVEQIRAALFSSVSHDLRTPLATIKAGVTSLMEPGSHFDAAGRNALLSSMLEETDRLNRLVGNILSLAKARAGGLALHRELVPIEDIVESVLRRLEPRVGPAQIVTRIRDDVPAIWVDALQLDQAITNVVENALRFAPPGTSVTVTVVPWHGGIEIRIADRGPGIPAEDREHVFEAFVRRGDRSPGGSGLGLAIARAVVVAHGGRITVQETPGGGCTVVLELPPGSEPS